MISAQDAVHRDARMRWFIVHQRISRFRFDQRIAEGARFSTWTGDPLPTLDEVKAAMKRDHEVISK